MAASADSLLLFFFSPKGRISRREFVLGLGFIWAVSLAVLSLMLNWPEDGSIAGLFAILGLPLSVSMVILVVKRCHDFRLPGAFCLLLAVPMVNIVWLLALCFIPGTAGPNAYGSEPRFES